MADLSDEFRVKVSEDMHGLFHAICTANGEDMATRLRRLVQSDIEAELHKHTLMQRLLRGKGIAVEAQGTAA